MKIGLDIDGVIYPWHYSIVRYFQEFRGFEGSDYEFWDMFNSLSPKTQEYYVSIPTLYSDSCLTEDAEKYLPLIAELGEIFYITARDTGLQWLTRKFFDTFEVPFKENLIFEKHKFNMVRLLGLDYFVDDQGKHLEKMKGITKTFLFIQPHNRNDRELYDNVRSLRQFYDIIKETK